METLTGANPNSRELLTEALDETIWWSAISLIVEFLRAKNVESVRVKFGFVLDRDLAGKEQGRDQTLRLVELKRFIQTGIDEGTIERSGSSDFVFYAMGLDLAFMLCNDADLHFASAEASLLGELGQILRSCGIKVYDSGRLI